MIETAADRKQVNSAMALLRHVVNVGGPDMVTSRADARIALCIARGVALEDIDCNQGYDISDRAYHHVRFTHVRNLREQPESEYAERDARWGHALWMRHRPDLASGDDWIAAARRTGDE